MDLLARRLFAARAAAGLTQTALRCDIHHPNLNALERGKAGGIRGDTLYRLCQVLNCSADCLLGLTDDPHPRPRRRAKGKAGTTGDPDADDADDRCGWCDEFLTVCRNTCPGAAGMLAAVLAAEEAR